MAFGGYHSPVVWIGPSAALEDGPRWRGELCLLLHRLHLPEAWLPSRSPPRSVGNLGVLLIGRSHSLGFSSDQ